MGLSMVRSLTRDGAYYIQPKFLAIVAYMIYLLSNFFPPGLYEDIVLEKNYIFLNPIVFVYVTCCILFFVIGSSLERGKGVILSGRRHKDSLLIYVFVIVVFALCLNVYSVFSLIRLNPEFLVYVFSGEDEVERQRNELDVASSFSEALPLSIAVNFWAYYRWAESQSRGAVRNMLGVALVVSVLVASLTCILKLARYELMPLLFGLAVIKTLTLKGLGKAERRRLMVDALLFAVAVAVVFGVFSWLRGHDTSSAVARSLLGYGPASYNRLALVLEGQLIFPTAGTFVNTFPGLFHIPLLHRFVDLQNIFGLPDPEVARLWEFSSVARTGLEGNFNWLTAFGYVYQDLGWFSLLYFLFFGVLAKRLWRWAAAGRAFGLVLYPFLAFSIFFWFGSSYFFRSSFFTWIALAFLCGFVERVSDRGRKIKEGR